jgi:site-specific DNA-methyltransferase (cytosine-N4-specific)
MSDARLEWRGYRYFPYERDFAHLEVANLFGTEAKSDGKGLRIPSGAFKASRAERLTYFARAVAPSGDVIVPRQARLEATLSKNSASRQATRYSAHSLHEYKGRFNPQVVRAIGNILGLPEQAWVLDPFCGSGTTLLECAHSGWNGVGIDRNPLAVGISNAKLRSLRNASRLAEYASRIAAEIGDMQGLATLEVNEQQIHRALGAAWSRELAAFDYLCEWFPMPVLAQIAAIRRIVSRVVRAKEDRHVFDIILSDHLRDVSLQEPLDLRIRRRKYAAVNYPLTQLFADSLEVRLGRVLRAREALGEVEGSQQAILADNRNVDQGIRKPRGGFDAVITSPPYETALPYIDTHRLSLVLLGYISPSQIQSTERELTGAREISVRERRELESEIRDGNAGLPNEIMDLCRELLSSAYGPGNGFRRNNRPALAYRYFKNMAQFFSGLKNLVRPGGKVALVVGPSKTTLSGKEYVIDTPRLLTLIGKRYGLRPVLLAEMDTYQRYDLHQKNSIATEMLTVMQAES